jgi:hypothetical protein
VNRLGVGRQRNCNSLSVRGKIFLSSSEFPERAWDSPHVLFSGYIGSFLGINLA